MRTTVNIDDPILKDVKELQQARGVHLGQLISELLMRGLRDLQSDRSEAPRPGWTARDMGARVDIADKDALMDLLEDRPTREVGAEEKQ